MKFVELDWINSAVLKICQFSILKAKKWRTQWLRFDVENRETHVCRLQRALYGIKQALQAWYSRIDNYLWEMSFQWSEADHNLYFLSGEVPLILVLYANDIFLLGDERMIYNCKSPCSWVWDERPWVDALLPRIGGLEERWVLLHWIGEVCSGDLEEIQDGGLQAHVCWLDTWAIW